MLSAELKSHIKRYTSFFIAFIAAYAIALIALVPDSLVEQKLQSSLSQYASWESMNNKNGVWQLRGVKANAYPKMSVELVEIEPRWLPLVFGKASANINARIAELNVVGTASKGVGGMSLSFEAEAEKFVDLALSPWPELGTLSSAQLQASGHLVFNNDGKIDDSQMTLRWSDIEVQGLNFKAVTVSGDWEEDHFKLTANSEGDLQITLFGELKPQFKPKLGGQIEAKLNVVADPGLPLIKEIMGTNSLQLQLKGALTNIKAACTNKKQCPEWVKQI